VRAISRSRAIATADSLYHCILSLSLMKIAAHLAATLLGLAFIAFGAMFLGNLMPAQPAPPEGSAAAHFMAAFVPTGYLKFVKICELVGGVLVLLPYTRRAGLLILGPILINILAFHGFVAGAGLFDPLIIGLCALALFLVWAERAAFGRFISGR
jgi:putative oxidoreductase